MPTMAAHSIRGRRITYAVIFGLLIFTAAVRLLLFPDVSPRQHLRVFFVSLFFVWFLYEVITRLHRFLNQTLPLEQGIGRRIAVQAGLGILFLSLCRTVMYLCCAGRFPIEMSKGLIAASYLVDVLMILAINGGYFGKYFFDAWRTSVTREEQLRKQSAVCQYENLRNQLNPHFLFNSLTSLNSLITEDAGRASHFVQQLSKVYRYILQNGERDLVSLQAELDFIQNYTLLLKERLGSSLIVKIDIAHESRDCRIVPVALQILIENAIRHNIASQEAPLLIEVYTEGSQVVVRNNLQRKSSVEAVNKTGLENMCSLYAFISQQRVEVNETPEFFMVKIPLLD